MIVNYFIWQRQRPNGKSEEVIHNTEYRGNPMAEDRMFSIEKCEVLQMREEREKHSLLLAQHLALG